MLIRHSIHNPSVFKLVNKDTSDEILVTTKSIEHGLDDKESVIATYNLYGLLSNAIKINELGTRGNVPKSDVYLGYREDANGVPYYVRFTVHNKSDIKTLTDFDVLYAVTANKRKKVANKSNKTNLTSSIDCGSVLIRPNPIVADGNCSPSADNQLMVFFCLHFCNI